MNIRYLSICSGIEAASVAFGPLGWQPVAFSEIDPYCCALLAHRYPGVPNLGDMTQFDQWEILNHAGAVDLVCGGTPCQGFSRGNRTGAGLADHRSGLALAFVDILEAVQPAWFIWENVAGIQERRMDVHFRQIVARFAGRGYGVAWRVLDGRDFGSPCARRRMFVVGRLGSPTAAGAVLLEPESARWDFASPAHSQALPCLTARGYASYDDRTICTRDSGGVRRLMPVEWERLMGFPDDYTLIPYRGKPAADGPRYRALGNSWAVNCARWIARRIEMVEGMMADGACLDATQRVV